MHFLRTFSISLRRTKESSFSLRSSVNIVVKQSLSKVSLYLSAMVRKGLEGKKREKNEKEWKGREDKERRGKEGNGGEKEGKGLILH